MEIWNIVGSHSDVSFRVSSEMRSGLWVAQAVIPAEDPPDPSEHFPKGVQNDVAAVSAADDGLLRYHSCALVNISIVLLVSQIDGSVSKSGTLHLVMNC